jgi:hypothetical protein
LDRLDRSNSVHERALDHDAIGDYGVDSRQAEPLDDVVWLCLIDQRPGLEIGVSASAAQLVPPATRKFAIGAMGPRGICE